jgi:hypothetical protein
MEQRMRSSALRGNISIWAWTASIIVHAVLLAGLTVVEFSPGERRSAVKRTPSARLARIQEIAHSSFLMPKPKIERKGIVPPRSVPGCLQIQQITAAPEKTACNLDGLTAGSVGASGVLPYDKISRAGAEFFGTPLGARKVCFLVDCSGSMHGMFRKVAERLKNTVMDLRADQYFYIIFFGWDELIENGGGKLIRATEQSKSNACDFIDRTAPGGGTNILAALERAMQIQDNHGQKPSVIFFLTDGFELLPGDNDLLPGKIMVVRKRLSPEVKINTIGFWAQPTDCAVLRAIARESGGEFSYVEP